MKAFRTRIAKICVSAIIVAGIIPSLPVVTSSDNNTTVYAAEKSSKLDAPKNFRASQITETSITLTWSAVKGADAYRVFFYNTETKEYESYKVVSDTSCVIKNLTADTAYRFKVSTLVKNKGKYTEQTRTEQLIVKTQPGKKLDAPTNIKKVVSGNEVELSWDPVEGADGYRVYIYNESSKKYDTYKTVSSTSCTISDLDYYVDYKIKIVTLVKKKSKYINQSSTSAYKIMIEREVYDVEPKEWVDPKRGEYRANVLLECGIGNYTERTLWKGGHCYEGETIYCGVKGKVVLVFTHEDTVEFFSVRIPSDMTTFKEIVDSAKKRYGTDYTTDRINTDYYIAGTIDATKYSWVKNNYIVTLTYYKGDSETSYHVSYDY